MTSRDAASARRPSGAERARLARWERRVRKLVQRMTLLPPDHRALETVDELWHRKDRVRALLEEDAERSDELDRAWRDLEEAWEETSRRLERPSSKRLYEPQSNQ